MQGLIDSRLCFAIVVATFEVLGGSVVVIAVEERVEVEVEVMPLKTTIEAVFATVVARPSYCSKYSTVEKLSYSKSTMRKYFQAKVSDKMIKEAAN